MFEASERGGPPGRLALGELKHGRNGDDGGLDGLAGARLRPVQQMLQDLGRQFFGRCRAVCGREGNGLRGTHEPLEFSGGVCRIGLPETDGFGTHRNGRVGRHVNDRGDEQAVRSLNHFGAAPILARDGGVGRAKINAVVDCCLHGVRFAQRLIRDG